MNSPVLTVAPQILKSTIAASAGHCFSFFNTEKNEIKKEFKVKYDINPSTGLCMRSKRKKETGSLLMSYFVNFDSGTLSKFKKI
jgi:hypothetical protein